MEINEEEFDKKRDAFLSDADRLARIKAVYDLSVVKKPTATNQTNTDKALDELIDDEKNIIDEELVGLIKEKSGTKVDKTYIDQLKESTDVGMKMVEVEDLIEKFNKRIVELDVKVAPLLEQKKEYEQANKFLKDYIIKLGS
jgi:hypothetical protein